MSDLLVPVFYSEKIIKARKPRGCSECEGRIEPGERYTVISGKWPEIGFDVIHQCADCKALAEDCRKWDTTEDGPGLKFLSDWLGDMNGDEGIAELQARFDATRVKRGKDPVFPPEEDDAE